MSLKTNENLASLEAERERLLREKKVLLEQFRYYAGRKLTSCGIPFKVTVCAINGRNNFRYDDLKNGQRFSVEYSSFTYDPKTSVLTDYMHVEFEENKYAETLDEVIATSAVKPLVTKLDQLHMTKATETDMLQILTIREQKSDNIVSGIFKGELSFDDWEFKSLIISAKKLEEAIQTLNNRFAYMKNGDNGPQTGTEIEDVKNAPTTEIMKAFQELGGADDIMVPSTQKTEGKAK